MSSLDIQVEPLEGVEKGVMVRLDGALDQPTRDTFLNRLKSVLNEGNIRCVLDMQRVTYANSTAIGDLVIQFDLFREAGGELVLLNPQRKVYVIIEMVGVNTVLPIFNTLEEAKRHLLARSAAAPAPATVAASSGASAAATPPAVTAQATSGASFPVRADCTGCGVVLEFAQAGRFRCPRCSTIYAVDPAGRAVAGRPRTGLPIEVTLPCQPQALKAFQQMVGALPSWSGYTDLERARLESAIAEVCETIAQKAYEGNRDNVFQVLLLYRDDELALRFADHGRLLSAAAFPVASQYMSEFEHRPHPVRGNFLRMVKRQA